MIAPHADAGQKRGAGGDQLEAGVHREAVAQAAGRAFQRRPPLPFCGSKQKQTKGAIDKKIIYLHSTGKVGTQRMCSAAFFGVCGGRCSLFYWWTLEFFCW